MFTVRCCACARTRCDIEVGDIEVGGVEVGGVFYLGPKMVNSILSWRFPSTLAPTLTPSHCCTQAQSLYLTLSLILTCCTHELLLKVTILSCSTHTNSFWCWLWWCSSPAPACGRCPVHALKDLAHLAPLSRLAEAQGTPRRGVRHTQSTGRQYFPEKGEHGEHCHVRCPTINILRDTIVCTLSAIIWCIQGSVHHAYQVRPLDTFPYAFLLSLWRNSRVVFFAVFYGIEISSCCGRRDRLETVQFARVVPTAYVYPNIPTH